MAKKGDDFSSVAIDVTAGQEKVLELVRNKSLEASKTPENTSAREPAPPVAGTKDTATHSRSEPIQKNASTSTGATQEKRKRRRRPINSKKSTQVTQPLGSRRDDDRWVTPTFKVKEQQQQALERVYFLMRASGTFSGTKQAFFDEGLSYLLKKYSDASPSN